LTDRLGRRSLQGKGVGHSVDMKPKSTVKSDCARRWKELFSAPPDYGYAYADYGDAEPAVAVDAFAEEGFGAEGSGGVAQSADGDDDWNESRARREKNPTAMRLTPIHIQGRRMERRTKLKIDPGLKSWISPMLFMARLTHNSPPVPATIMKKNRATSRSKMVNSRGVGMSAADDKDAKANYQDTQPSQGGDHLAQNEVTQDGDRGVGKGSGGLHITVIRPSEQEHVNDKKSQQTGNADPDVG
jgi:hypothetical protein